MPELQDLRAVVETTADNAQLPGFAQLEARARRRRLRRQGTVMGGLLAMMLAVAVVGGLKSGMLLGARHLEPAAPTHHRARTHHPAHTGQPTPKPSTARGKLDAMTAEQVVNAGRLYSYGSGGSGEILTVWQVCIQDSRYCRYAWRLADRSGQLAVGDAWSADGASGPRVVPGGSYVLAAWDRRGIVVSPSGTVIPLHPGPSETIQPGGFVAVVQSGKTGLEAVDTTTGASWPLPLPPGSDAIAQATVAADATVWALPAFAGPGKVEVSWLTGGHWQSHSITGPRVTGNATPGVLVETGTIMGDTHIAALSSYDGATILPVGVLAVSTDSGRSWRQLTGSQVPFTAVDSMAADATGTLYVADPNGLVWRSVDPNWTHFTRVHGIRAYDLHPAGEQVLARPASDQSRLVLIGADGTVQPVPAR